MRICTARCSRCLNCVSQCLFNAISTASHDLVIDEALCTDCGMCRDSCPMDAISDEMHDDPVEAAEQRGICLYLTATAGRLSEGSLEVLGAGLRLREHNRQRLTAFLLGEYVHEAAEEAIRCGADEVWLAEHSRLTPYAVDLHAGLVTDWLKELGPSIVLSGDRSLERSVMGYAAVRLHTGLCADCIQAAIDPQHEGLVVTRTAFGGQLMADIHIPRHRPQMATLKEGAFRPPPVYQPSGGLIVNRTDDISGLNSVYELLESRKIERLRNDFANAQIIVAVGRGIGCAEQLDSVYELADLLDARIGATRAVVESGWLDVTHQIGQSGTIVRPQLYIACGISGALQHTIGMDQADRVIAINSDRDAPIFQYADYGIVGDVRQVLPRLSERIRERRAARSRNGMD